RRPYHGNLLTDSSVTHPVSSKPIRPRRDGVSCFWLDAKAFLGYKTMLSFERVMRRVWPFHKEVTCAALVESVSDVVCGAIRRVQPVPSRGRLQFLRRGRKLLFRRGLSGRDVVR